MILALLYAIGPIALYLGLVALPAGGLRRRAFGGATALLALGWLAWPLRWGPFGGDAMENAVLGLALLLWTLALGLAGLLQEMRPRLARRGPLAYPLASLGALAFVLLAAAAVLGPR